MLKKLETKNLTHKEKLPTKEERKKEKARQEEINKNFQEKVTDMFYLQSQKSDFSCAFIPALTVFGRGYKKDAPKTFPEKSTPAIVENDRMETPPDPGQKTPDNRNARISLPSLSGMIDTAKGDSTFYEKFEFYARLRLLSIAGCITAIAAIAGGIIAG